MSTFFQIINCTGFVHPYETCLAITKHKFVICPYWYTFSMATSRRHRLANNGHNFQAAGNWLSGPYIFPVTAIISAC